MFTRYCKRGDQQRQLCKYEPSGSVLICIDGTIRVSAFHNCLQHCARQLRLSSAAPSLRFARASPLAPPPLRGTTPLIPIAICSRTILNATSWRQHSHSPGHVCNRTTIRGASVAPLRGKTPSVPTTTVPAPLSVASPSLPCSLLLAATHSVSPEIDPTRRSRQHQRHRLLLLAPLRDPRHQLRSRPHSPFAYQH